MPLAIRILLFRFFLWLVALGCFLSGAASGRFSMRLVADGAIAFAFIPVLTIAACVIVLRTGARSGMRLRDAIGAFLDGNGPWLLWLTLVAALVSIVPPRSLGPWIGPIGISLLIPLVCCLVIDLRFFRETIGRTTRQAWRALVLQRLLSWGGIVVYFLGIAIWGEFVPQVAGWAGW